MPHAHSENRTSLSEAVTIVLGTLQNNGEQGFTVNDLVKSTHLNPRTIRKTISVLEGAHQVFAKQNLVVSKTNSGIYVTMEPRQTGLLNLPEDVQRMLIRTKYFPQPSRDQEILVHLHMKKAFDAKSAVFLDKAQSIVKELLESENIAMTEDSRIYLTDIGKMVALGTFELYPELNTI